jgi:hypothetical protein
MRNKLLTVIAVCAAAILLVAFLSLDREPRYGDRVLHEWIHLFPTAVDVRAGKAAQAENAIQQIGTNAIPFLLRWLSTEWQPSRSKQRLATFVRNIPFLTRFHPISRWALGADPLQRRADEAAAAFEALGSNAAPAIPELARLATYSPQSGTARRAVDALVNIGPITLPALLTVITNANAQARFYAVTSIQSFGTNARPAIPMLLTYRGDATLASGVYEVLGRLKLEPQEVVPALERTAHDPNPSQRSLAIIVLGDYGAYAKPAVPVLMAALSDADSGVLDSATNALNVIAPEILATPQHK